MKGSNSYHLTPFLLIISLSLAIDLINIYPFSASASDEVPAGNQAEETLLINDKEPSGLVVNEPGQEGTTVRNLPTAEEQIKADNKQPAEAHKEAENPGEISNNDAPLLQEQADLNTPEITIVINKHVVNHITYFQTRIREKFTLWLSRSSHYIPMMKQILKESALPEDLVYLSLIESGFNPNAYSRARAVGPWQFIKATGKKYGLRIDEWVDERRNPVKSTIAAARYLKDLFDMFGSWELAMASYNAGEGKIQRALIRSKGDDFWDLTSTKHIKRETKEYVPKFMAATLIAKDPERYGFEVEYWSPMLYDEITVDSPTDLAVIARASEASLEEIKELNPHLKRNMTPPGEKEFVVHIPHGKSEIFYKNFNAIPRDERIKTQKYKVKKGETLSIISRRYGIPVDTLSSINGFSKDKILREGDLIVLAPILATPRKRIEYARRDDNDLTYRVRKGDTLWDISKRFNIPVDQLKKWNGIGRGNKIKSGDRLILNPDGATG